MDSSVDVNIDGQHVWSRSHSHIGPGGMTKRNKPMLTQVVSLLAEGLTQAKEELRLLDVVNGVADGCGTSAEINDPVPVA
jgi:hypothetical protein